MVPEYHSYGTPSHPDVNDDGDDDEVHRYAHHEKPLIPKQDMQKHKWTQVGNLECQEGITNIF